MDEFKKWLSEWYSKRIPQLTYNLLEYEHPARFVWNRGKYESDKSTIENSTGLKFNGNFLEYINGILGKTQLIDLGKVSPDKVAFINNDVKGEVTSDLKRVGYLDGKYFPQQAKAFKFPWGRPTIEIHELTHGIPLPSELYKIETIIKGNINTLKSPSDSYYNSPDEVKSRLMEFRYKNNIDPTHKFTIDEIQLMRGRAYHIFDYLDSYDSKGSKYREPKNGEIVDFDLFNRYDDNTILRLLNEVAYNENNKNKSNVKYAKTGSPLNYLNYFK